MNRWSCTTAGTARVGDCAASGSIARVPSRQIAGFLLVLCMASVPALAVPPEPFLKTDSLVARVGRPFALTLNLPSGDTWATANIGQFMVRAFGPLDPEIGVSAQQQSLDPVGPAAAGNAFTHTFANPGYALVVLGAGPAGEKGHGDSWQRTNWCTKLVVRIDPDAGDNAEMRDAGVTAKVGQKIELLPMIAPYALVPGADLPVRAYFNNDKAAGKEVTAYRPDGSTDVQTTGSVGVANFRITQAGRWMIRFDHTDAGTTYTAELVFDVSNAAEGN